MYTPLLSMAFALCPHSVVLMDRAALDEERDDRSRDELRALDDLDAVACNDHPDIASWNRHLAKDCAYQARMRDGKVHLDEARLVDGDCVAMESNERQLSRRSDVQRGPHAVSDLGLVILRGGPMVAPYQNEWDLEVWPDILVAHDRPTTGEILDLVFPDGWEMVASRTANTRYLPLGSTRRARRRADVMSQNDRHALGELYGERQRGEISHDEMLRREAAILRMLDAMASKKAAFLKAEEERRKAEGVSP